MAALLPNSCFMHIPRTGGSYIRDVLKDLGLYQGETGSDADRPYQYRNHSRYKKTKKDSGERELFTFIREPRHWYVSLWNTRQDTGYWPLLDETDESMFYVSTSADSWILKLLLWRPGLYRNTFADYGVYNSNVMVGHTETLESDLRDIILKLEGISYG